MAVPQVEMYVDRSITNILEVHADSTNQIGKFLFDHYGAEYTRTWDNRVKIMDKAFSFNVKSTVEHREFQLLVDLRNALMHGAGRFTNQQVANWTKHLQRQKDLKSRIPIQIEGDHFYFMDNSSERIRDIAVDYLLMIEQRVCHLS